MTVPNDVALQANQLPISIEFPKETENFYETLSLWQKRVSNAVNSKEGGLHNLVENFSFKQYYTTGNPDVFRNVYRFCFDLVALNGGPIGGGITVSFPHGIIGLLYAGDIKANCTSAIPTYFSVMGPTSIRLDAVNIVFTNPLGTPLTAVTAIAEYLKN